MHTLLGQESILFNANMTGQVLQTANTVQCQFKETHHSQHLNWYQACSCLASEIKLWETYWGVTIIENEASLYASWVHPASPESYGRWYFNWFYWFQKMFGTESFSCGPPSDTQGTCWQSGDTLDTDSSAIKTAQQHHTRPLFSKTFKRIWIKYILKKTTHRHEFNHLILLHENVFLFSYFYVKTFHPVIVKTVCSSWSWHLSGGKEGLFILMKSSLNACACLSRTVCVRQRCPFKKIWKMYV